MSQAVFNTYLFSKLPYDPQRDLAPITTLVSGAFVLVTHAGFLPNTLAAFIEAAKAKPGTINLGTAANGSPPHIAAQLLARAAGIQLTFVPFASGAEGMRAAMRGDVQVFLDAPTLVVPQIRAGTLKALAVTGAHRERELPDVPTVAEAGLPEGQNEAWIGLVAPAETSRVVIARINAESAALLERPDLLERLRSLSFLPMASSPEGFGDLIRREHERWGPVIRAAGIKLE